MKEFGMIFIGIFAMLLVTASVEHARQEHDGVQAKREGQAASLKAPDSVDYMLSNGVAVPGVNQGVDSGYPCDLGELGKHETYDRSKSFWGDDQISKGFAGASSGLTKLSKSDWSDLSI